MSLKIMMEILNAYSRLLEYLNNNGHDEVIENVSAEYDSTLIITLRGHGGETYEQEVWNSYTTGELCVEDPVTHQSFFDYSNEHGMSEQDVYYIKHGKRV